MLTKFIKLKEPTLTNGAHTKYKLYRNMLVTLLNKINDLKNTWKGIKRVISLKYSTSKVPSTITEDKISLTNPTDIADALNNYFSDVATGIESWLSSYLQNRTQFVNINDFDCDVNTICCGVPQGSIPGPLKKMISILL